MQLPVDCDHDHISLPRDELRRPLPEVINGFKDCLGVPRHPTRCDIFITKAMLPLAERHDSLLDLVADVSEEDPFSALLLLQVFGFNRLVTF